MIAIFEPSRRIVATAVVLGIVTLMLATELVSSTASNTVPPTKAGRVTHAATITEIRPTQCAGVVLTDFIIGTSSTVSGGNGNSLILANRSVRTISAGKGNDCVVASADVTTIDGGAGTDVCIGPN